MDKSTTVVPRRSLSDFLAAAISNATSPIIGQVESLLPRASRRQLAYGYTGEKHRGIPVMEINERSLERNIYAPWGRGYNSGLRGGPLPCQPTYVGRCAEGTVQPYIAP